MKNKKSNVAYNFNDLSGLVEYLLIVSPSEEVYNQTLTEKKRFFDLYKNEAAVYGKPHITLANYIQPASTENNIGIILKHIGERSNKIKVVLKDYDWFKQGVIFFNVLHKTDIKQLVRKIQLGIKRLMLIDDDFPPRFINYPHLTLCKNLSEAQFNQSKIDYADKRFSGEFIASAMLLLKRPIGHIKYEVAASFDLGGPESFNCITQGKLF